MSDLARELENAIEVEDSIASYWAEVHLKSGSVLWVPGAASFEVRKITVQEESINDKVVHVLVQGEQVCFYDSDDDYIDDVYLPFENVAAIRIVSPFATLPDEAMEES